jgi:Flp pilus assembly protein TadB
MDASVIVGLLVIAAVWSVYLLPQVFGERKDAPINSTEEFDRWTHSIAHVQKQSTDVLASPSREVIKNRRRRTLTGLIALIAISLALAWYLNSLPLLLVGLFFGSLLALYLTVLSAVQKSRLERQKVIHVAERPSEWDEPQIKVIAN